MLATLSLSRTQQTTAKGIMDIGRRSLQLSDSLYFLLAVGNGVLVTETPDLIIEQYSAEVL